MHAPLQLHAVPVGVFGGLLLDVLAPEDDLHGSLGAHHGDLGAGPSVVVVTLQVFGRLLNNGAIEQKQKKTLFVKQRKGK